MFRSDKHSGLNVKWVEEPMSLFSSKRNIIIAALAALFVIYSFATVTVVKEGEEAKLTGEVAFDPTSVATNFWQQDAESYFSAGATDFVTLVNESNGDFTSLASKYGHYSMGDSGELSFIVKGTGTVDTVKNKLRAGYLALKVDGYTGNAQIRLQIGPVFKGSAVRDTISKISYRDYKNQIEWAQVSVAFHDLISKEILAPIDMNSMQGKKVEFIGCFTVGRPSQILITPVSLKVL